MKRICFYLSCTLFFLISFESVYSQDSPVQNDGSAKKPKFWYGPKVGVDLVTPTFDQNDIKAQLKSNYQLGMFFQFGRKLYLQPEFYIAFENENRNIASTATKEVMVKSLKVPVLIGLKLIDIGLVSAHVMAGPSGSYFLTENKSDAEIMRKRSDYKLQLGGGVDVLGFITLDVRYNVNMNEQLKEELTNLTWDSAVNVTLGLKFR